MTTDQELRETALKDVKMYMANGWDVAEETPQAFVLKRNEASTAGHILVFILFCWTFGIANLIYHFAKKKKKIIMK